MSFLEANKIATQEDKIIVDVIGEKCPIPLVEMRKAVMRTKPGQLIEVIGNHRASKKEIPMALDSLGKVLIGIQEDADGVWHVLFIN